MVDVQTVRKLLAEQYGIKSDLELLEALAKNKKVNIGVFTAPTKRKDDRHDNRTRCIA